MGWFKKKADPISERARALNEEIAALEAQIRQLDKKNGRDARAPRLRSTAMPHGATIVPPQSQPKTPPVPPPSATDAREPIFEEVDLKSLQAGDESGTSDEHFNDLGMRKYDLAGLLRRIKNHFRGPSTANPKLVNYLAAGSIQGLRPMRYEKRVARNRFLLLAALLLVLLIGLFALVRKH